MMFVAASLIGFEIVIELNEKNNMFTVNRIA
jgi:hypothetical protein